MKVLNIVAAACLAGSLFFSCATTGKVEPKKVEKPETVTFASQDGIPVTTDLYMAYDKKAPLILLCHRANWSRGEYLEIAPKLNLLGFNAIAIDQRSGKTKNDVDNATKKAAEEAGKGTTYLDAIQDIQAAIDYASKLSKKKIILWGSSYSSSLGFMLAKSNSDKIAALLCLNQEDSLTISDEEKTKIKCRIFFFSPTFLNKKLNFQNILVKGPEAESEVIENRMILKTFINSKELHYFRYIKPEDKEHIADLMKKAAFQLSAQDSGWWPCKTRSFLSELLFFTAQLFELRQNENEEITSHAVSPDFKPILDYIARSYEKKLTLDGLSAEFGTNRTDLNKLFKMQTGMTAIKYVIDLRLRIARSLLKDTDLPIEQIAAQTSFSIDAFSAPSTHSLHTCYDVF